MERTWKVRNRHCHPCYPLVWYWNCNKPNWLWACSLASVQIPTDRFSSKRADQCCGCDASTSTIVHVSHSVRKWDLRAVSCGRWKDCPDLDRKNIYALVRPLRSASWIRTWKGWSEDLLYLKQIAGNQISSSWLQLIGTCQSWASKSSLQLLLKLRSRIWDKNFDSAKPHLTVQFSWDQCFWS